MGKNKVDNKNRINGKRPEFGNPEHIKWLEEKRKPPIDLTTDNGLISVVKEFTDGLSEGRKAQGMCFMVCAPLSGYLSFLGVENDVMECEVKVGEDAIWQHFYLQLKDGRVLDPTASQFISPITYKRMPDCYLGQKPDWYLNNKISKQ